MSSEKPAGRVVMPSLPDPEPLPEAVLFGFDDRAFPFHNYVQTHLIPGQSPTLVLDPGPAGAYDERIRFYGTVMRIDDTFHMWYNGMFGPPRKVSGVGCTRMRLCYATSNDGVHWQRPDLGLVEYEGNKKNNLVDFPVVSYEAACPILHDPEDPNPQRRFKMVYEAPVEGKIHFCVAFSPDGLRWQLYEGNPAGPFLEMTGLTKFRGLYYVNGQTWWDIQRPVLSRHLETFVSEDFEHWSQAAAMGLDRTTDLVGPSRAADRHCYEEVHLGAALWNRGNVLVGIYGQWHGHPSGDRRLLTMDLGLALSHDCLHFYEPIPGFQFVLAREQPGSDSDMHPALMQGQGMENVGDRTLFWYGMWNGVKGTGVRMVSWERDRLGMLKAFKPKDGRAITCPLRVLEGGQAKVFVNASGLGEYTRLRIGLLDRGFRPIPGYSGDDAAVITTDGFRSPVLWHAGDALLPEHGLVRVDVQFEGIRPEDCRLHAVYVTGED